MFFGRRVRKLCSAARKRGIRLPRGAGRKTPDRAPRRTSGTAPRAPADSLEGEELISNYASHKKGCLLPYEARVILEG